MNQFPMEVHEQLRPSANLRYICHWLATSDLMWILTYKPFTTNCRIFVHNTVLGLAIPMHASTFPWDCPQFIFQQEVLCPPQNCLWFSLAGVLTTSKADITWRNCKVVNNLVIKGSFHVSSFKDLHIKQLHPHTHARTHTTTRTHTVTSMHTHNTHTDISMKMIQEARWMLPYVWFKNFQQIYTV